MKQWNFNRINNEKRAMMMVGVFLIIIASFAYNDIKTSLLGTEFYPAISLRNGVSVIYENAREEPIFLPYTIGTNRPFTVKLDLSSHGNLSGQSLAVSVNYASFSLTVDGKKIYQYQVPKDAWVKSGAYSIHIIDLPANITNKTVELKITPLLDSVSKYKIANVFIGNKSNIILTNFLDDFPFYICIFTLFLFFIIIISFSFINKRQKNFDTEILQLGLLCFYLGIYFLVQLWSFNYFFGRFHTVIYFLEYTVLMIIVTPVLFFIRRKLNPIFGRWILLMANISFWNLLLQYGLMIFGVLEFRELLPLTRFIVNASTMLIIMTFLFSDGKKYPQKKILFISILPLLVGVSIATAYYSIYGRLRFTWALMVCILIFIVIQFYQAYQNYSFLQNERIKSSLYKEMALVDSMTGLHNRTAYSIFLEDFTHKDQDAWILSIDLNNLKYVNDKYGHAYGDKLIINMSNILKEVMKGFSDYEIFRMGGDEFLVYLREKRSFDIEALVKELKAMSAALGKKNPLMSPQFAVGTQFHLSGDREKIEESILIADKKMYSDKALNKKKTF